MGLSHTAIACVLMLPVTARQQILDGYGPPAVALCLDYSWETALLQKLMQDDFRWESWLQGLT